MLPPYARKHIVNVRDLGRHPFGVAMNYCSQVVKKNRTAYPLVVVLADEFKLGNYEFWFAAGLPCWLYNRVGGADPGFIDFTIAVASVTAPVTVFNSQGLMDIDMLEFMLACRTVRDGRYQFPAGWTDKGAARYESRREAVLFEIAAELEAAEP